MRARMGGAFRADVELVSRNTNPLPERVFAAPGGYKKVELEPFFKQYEAMMDKYSEFLSGKIPDFSDLPDIPGMPGFPGRSQMPEL